WAKHVVSCCVALADAGSIPAASTTLLAEGFTSRRIVLPAALQSSRISPIRVGRLRPQSMRICLLEERFRLPMPQHAYDDAFDYERVFLHVDANRIEVIVLRQ